MQNFGQILFVMWRETVEATLGGRTSEYRPQVSKAALCILRLLLSLMCSHPFSKTAIIVKA
jgi:hypothetical protein